MSVTRGTLVASGATARAAAVAEDVLAAVAPELVPGFRAGLPRAADVVARRLVGAAFREGLLPRADAPFLPLADGGYVVARGRRHAFDRLEVTERLPVDPARLLRRMVGPIGGADAIAAELTDATVNLAIAFARRDAIATELQARAAVEGAADSIALAAGLDADEQCLFFERLATEGHNLHPCGRTRLGWTVPDVLAHDLEAGHTQVGFVAVRRNVHVGDDVGRDLLESSDLLEKSVDQRRYAVTPVHRWQLDRIVRDRYADLVADGVLVPLDDELTVAPTASLRTVLVPERRRYLKLSLDIQVTSTRRTISVASTQNGPVLSRLLERLLDREPRVLLLAETAGSAVIASATRHRDLSAIVRSGLSGRLDDNETAVPGGALAAISPVTGSTVVAELVTRLARGRGLDRGTAALTFVEEYARLLLPPVLGLVARHGIGLEVHLQNCIPTFVDGVPGRLVVRDLAGMRIHPGRIGAPVTLWPGSVVVTGDPDVMRAKVAYTALQAHLAEIVVRLVESHDLDESAAWARVRSVVDEAYDRLLAEGVAAAAEDHAFFTAPTLPHKALLSMRMADGRGETGDIYVRVENPLR